MVEYGKFALTGTFDYLREMRARSRGTVLMMSLPLADCYVN